MGTRSGFGRINGYPTITISKFSLRLRRIHTSDLLRTYCPLIILVGTPVLLMSNFFEYIENTFYKSPLSILIIRMS
jgi:hypothetical protein